MEETVQQYTQRLIRTLGTKEPLEVLESTAAVLESYSKWFEKQGFQKPIAPGKWSGAQILAHFAEGEIVFAYRIRTVLSASGCDIAAYNQNEWVKHSGYLQAQPQLALALFTTVRRSDTAHLRSLSAAEWQYFGIHSERGKESITDMVRLSAGHDLNHLQQLEKIVKTS